MRLGESGAYDVAAVGGKTVRDFVPWQPPSLPPPSKDRLQCDLEAAVLAIGRLDGVSTLLPDKSLFL